MSAPPEGGDDSTDDSADKYRQARAILWRERVEDDAQAARVGKQHKHKVRAKKGPTEEDLLNLPPEEGMLAFPSVFSPGHESG
jgi:hypothetical protein